MSFAVPKLIWLILNPANLLLILACIGVLMLWTQRWRAVGRAVLSVTILVFLTAAILPIASWLVQPLENRFPPVSVLPDRVDGIIVLGGAVSPKLTEARGQPAIGGSAERLLRFVYLARHYPEARLAFAGGSGSLFPGSLTQADVVRQIFSEIGFDAGRVHFEDKSRNTYENARNLMEALSPAQDETWFLITSASHMPRAVGSFRKRGWDVVAYPVDYKTFGGMGRLGFSMSSGVRGLSGAAKEWVGLVAYYVMGRTSVLFPKPEPEAG